MRDDSHICLSFCSLFIIVISFLSLFTPSLLTVYDYHNVIPIQMGSSIITSIDPVYDDTYYYKKKAWLWTSQLTDKICKHDLLNIDYYGNVRTDGYQFFGRFFCTHPDGEIHIHGTITAINILLWIMIAISLVAIVFSCFYFEKHYKLSMSIYLILSLVMFTYCIVLYFVPYYSALRYGEAGVLLPNFNNTVEYIVLTSDIFYVTWGYTFYVLMVTSFIIWLVLCIIAMDRSKRKAPNFHNLDGTRTMYII